MNQGRIWCVVSPTVGLPLLLGSVCITSLIVHTAILTHTTWYGNLYQGKARENPALSMNTPAPAAAAFASQAQPAFTITVAPVTGTPGKSETSFVVTVAPNAAAKTLAANAPEATGPEATGPEAKKAVALAQAR